MTPLGIFEMIVISTTLVTALVTFNKLNLTK